MISGFYGIVGFLPLDSISNPEIDSDTPISKSDSGCVFLAEV